MTDRVSKLRESILHEAHHAFRREIETRWGDEFEAAGYSHLERAVLRIERMHALETPVLLPGERLVYSRSVNNRGVISVDSADIQESSSPLYSDREWAEIRNAHFIHFTGDVNNVCPCYENLLSCGTIEKKRQLRALQAGFCARGDDKGETYCAALIRVLDAVEDLATRYQKAAADAGFDTAAKLLSRVPFLPPSSFPEALQFMRILNFTLYLSSNHHSGLGRLDQYLYPYFAADMAAGRLDRAEALEWLEEFFLSLNKDTDLYYGMQRGDNGQAVTLGGKNPDGTESYNLLSELCMEASLELMLIDPKLNLRVHKGTSDAVLINASRLTRKGLGFPQYANDDIVIPALIKKGYAPEDAFGYAIAACWEFIIPGKGMDITDIEAISLPRVLGECLEQDCERIHSREALMGRMRERLALEMVRIEKTVANLFVIPAPFLSILMYRCAENARDMSEGNVYNNYGVVATGIATAVDSIAAICKLVFEEGRVSLPTLMEAVNADFSGEEALWATLRYDMPKFGNNDPEADDIAVELMDAFAEAVESGRNERGGGYRPGTGSAMYYIWHPREIGASPDGRRKGEYFSANFSPSLNVRLQGPLSVLRSFAKPDMARLINGGPVTLELHDTALKGENGVEKIAQLVRFFINVGGQQLQLNAVNGDMLRAAMDDPSAYQDLIVRVWGWSGYFVQLDEAYQKQIIQRCEFAL